MGWGIKVLQRNIYRKIFKNQYNKVLKVECNTIFYRSFKHAFKTTQYSFIFLFKYAASFDDSRQIPYNGNDYFNILYLFSEETD